MSIGIRAWASRNKVSESQRGGTSDQCGVPPQKEVPMGTKDDGVASKQGS